VAALQPADFAESKPQTLPNKVMMADIYGVKNAEGTWYVKFWVENDTRLVIRSCHGPKEPLKLASGIILQRRQPPE